MERILLILRHGKALRGSEYASDFERPLAPRGQHAAQTIGRLLAGDGPAPELIVASPARRALETARLVAAELDAVPLTEDMAIYAAALSSLKDVVEALPEETGKVLLVGHNPGFEDLVVELTGRNDVLLKTCSLAVVKLHGDSWAAAVRRGGLLVDLIHPRELEEGA